MDQTQLFYFVLRDLAQLQPTHRSLTTSVSVEFLDINFQSCRGGGESLESVRLLSHLLFCSLVARQEKKTKHPWLIFFFSSSLGFVHTFKIKNKISRSERKVKAD